MISVDAAAAAVEAGRASALPGKEAASIAEVMA
jgi:hypothetical protein